MKKKGLLISTIVMVVVLVASLTTATYAWFTTTSSTTISGFDIEVVPSNVLKIGVKQTVTGYVEGASELDFVNGTVQYVPGTAGKIGGSWSEGNQGLGASLDHQIKFSSVTNAVGVTTATTAEEAAKNNTFGFAQDDTTGATNFNADKFIVVANATSDGTGITGQAAAVANGYTSGDNEIPADYAYLHLGVAPTKDLKEGTNQLHIVVQSDGAAIGIGAALHVAYRINGKSATGEDGEWTDHDMFGTHRYTSTPSVAKTALPANIDADTLTASHFVVTGTELLGASVLTIDLENYDADAANPIDQIEIIIYIAGWDTDCNDNAINNVTVKVGMFFGAQGADDNAA